MKLILFDIDGTILQIGGQGRSSVVAALSSVLDRPISVDGVRFAGMTDRRIVRNVLLRNGFGPDEADSRISDCLDAYSSLAVEQLKVPGCVTPLPGVVRLIRDLDKRPDVQLGLLTGNIETVAWSKMEAVGLRSSFPFGAFGDDADDREQLPELAVGRARNHCNRDFNGKDVVVVGDTEHDIECGRVCGGLSVAVATGRYDKAFLQDHQPDVLLDDLTDTVGFFDAVFSPETNPDT